MQKTSKCVYNLYHHFCWLMLFTMSNVMDCCKMWAEWYSNETVERNLRSYIVWNYNSSRFFKLLLLNCQQWFCQHSKFILKEKTKIQCKICVNFFESFILHKDFYQSLSIGKILIFGKIRIVKLIIVKWKIEMPGISC